MIESLPVLINLILLSHNYFHRVSREKIKCLSILVSSEGIEKILLVPKLNNEDANLDFEIGSVLIEWNVKDRIKSLCFNTTATNTG